MHFDRGFPALDQVIQVFCGLRGIGHGTVADQELMRAVPTTRSVLALGLSNLAPAGERALKATEPNLRLPGQRRGRSAELRTKW